MRKPKDFLRTFAFLKVFIIKKKSMDTENFIRKAKEKHGNKYDYSKLIYVNSATSICITCRKHGDFFQKPLNHLRGYGCKECAKENLSKQFSLSKEKFIEKSITIYGNKYDYSKVEYVNNRTKVCIICPIHGEFWITPNDFLDGHSCPLCAKEYISKRLRNTTADFIEKAKNIHNGKYDYSKVEYTKTDDKVCIICPEHGEFWQTPHAHLSGKGCKKCGREKIENATKLNVEDFITRANKVHNFKYDYSKINYVNANTKVQIICPEHGEFWQKACDHLQGRGCNKCGGTATYSTPEFIKKAKEIHGDKYDYSKVNYINNRTKVCIICPEHGEFWMIPSHHFRGLGCPKCHSSVLENEISLFLKENNIEYIQEYNTNWLKKQRLDFFLPKYNIAIECQGEQHFRVIECFGGKEGLKRRQMLDEQKKELCNKNGVKIFYYSKLKINYPYKVFINKEKMLSEIYATTGRI